MPKIKNIISTIKYIYICDWCGKEVWEGTYLPPKRCYSCERYACVDHEKQGHTVYCGDSAYWYCEDCWSFGKSYREKIKKIRDVIEEYHEEIEQLEEEWEKLTKEKFGIKSKKGN